MIIEKVLKERTEKKYNQENYFPNFPFKEYAKFTEEIIKLFEKKGWALYYTPVFIQNTDELEDIIEKGRARQFLIPFESYMILPLEVYHDQPDFVFNAMQECWETGRVPFYIHFEHDVKLGHRLPKFVAVVSELAITKDLKVALFFDLPMTYEYQKVLGFRPPSDKDINYMAFQPYIEIEPKDLICITSRWGDAFIQPKQTYIEYSEYIKVVKF